MVLPVINLNGTSRDELLRQLIEAGRALRMALERLADATPHPRDYQINANPNADFKTALAEHSRRIELVREVYKEIETLGEAIA